MKSETKICPKCGNSFECRNSNIVECACIQIPLENKVRQLISESYDDCLCIPCLKEFSTAPVSGIEINS